MEKTNFKLKTKVLNRAVLITALLLVAGVFLTGCPQKVKEEPKPVYYTVSLVHEGGNLTADPAIQGGKALKDGEITFTASPANPSTHEVDTWEVTGGQVLEGGEEGSVNVKVKITGDTTVKVTFKKKTPSFISFNIPKAGILKAGTSLIAMVRGINFKAPDVGPSNFTVNCVDNTSVTTGSTVTILSDSELTVNLKIPEQVGDYTIIITSGTRSLRGTFSVKNYTGYTVGKIVLKDGTLVAKDDYTEIDTANPPVAVLIGAQNIYDAALGMALHISKFYPYWAKGESTGYNTNFEDIICTPQTSNASTTTFTGDINGSDNWYYICRIDPDGVANAAENYSAFDWVNRYNTTYSAQLGGANIAWYMPSIQELCQVYKNREAINESLAKIHGLENGGSYADLSLGNNDFWSSSQSSAKSIYNTAIYAWRLHSHGLIDDVSKYSNAKVCCVADF